MAFVKVNALETDVTVSLGGVNKKTGKPNPKSIEGYFLGSKTDLPNKFNPEVPTSLHVFKTSKGDVGVWGKTDLDRKMKAAQVGALTRITQTGSRPSKKGFDLLVFEVEIDVENTIEVAASESSFEAEESSDEGYETLGLDGPEDTLEEDVPMDEVKPARTLARPVSTPSAARQAQLQSLLKGKSAK